MDMPSHFLWVFDDNARATQAKKKQNEYGKHMTSRTLKTFTHFEF
jgi:hypothetical protein